MKALKQKLNYKKKVDKRIEELETILSYVEDNPKENMMRLKLKEGLSTISIIPLLLILYHCSYEELADKIKENIRKEKNKIETFGKKRKYENRK